MEIKIKHFNALSISELYAILALRQKIFIVEQDCPYLDADGVDVDSFHLTGRVNEAIVACLRIIPPGVQYRKYASIGRVAIDKSIRRKGLGSKLVQAGLSELKKHYPDSPVKISAQTYLIGFYSALGFRATREAYLEDDIPHVAMILDH